jgi:hypothetical protein
MGTDAFEDSQLRLQWAKESLADFERCARIYFRRTPCTPFIEPDSDGIHEHHKLRLRKPFPITLTKHTVYVIEDLRASLELTAIAVAKLLNFTPTELEEVHFPFCKSASNFKSRIGSCCKRFPQEITGLFGSFEPYDGTNNLLFAINELCNSSKHRIIVPVASAVGVNLPYMEGVGGTLPIRINTGGLFDREKNEITYATTERGIQLKYYAEFSFGVTFDNVGPLEGYPVAYNLDAMIRAVTEIIDATETETRRLGLI